MGLLTWIVVGLIAGLLAKVVMPGTADEPGGLLGTIILGIVGAVIGGWVWNLVLGKPGATGFDIGSLFVALVGSCLVIGILRLFNRRTVA